MNIIEIKDLHFGYGRGKAIYSGINLTLAAGSVYGLLGENGVGKTTLLRLVCGLLFPTSGSCQTFGNESKKRMPDMLEKIYYLPEAFDIPAVKVAEYERNYSRLYPNFSHDKFEEYLDIFSIDKNKKMKNFSHGQQKKAMIAFALACKTPLLLMDEPTNGLDIPSKSIFRQLISEAIDANTTFVISTHQVRDLENVIDPIIILEVNQVLLNNPVAEITDKLKFVLAAAPSPGALHSEQTLGGFMSVEPNNDGAESTVNVEVLFNTAIKNKEFFKSTFINNQKHPY